MVMQLFPHVSKVPTITYNLVWCVNKECSNVNIIHKKKKFCDNEVPKCIILVLFKRADGLNHHLDIGLYRWPS